MTPADTDAPLSKTQTVHFRVMRALEQNPRLTQRALADQLGVSLGAVNFCLSALVDKGLLKIENFKASENKWGYLYVLTPQGVAERAALTGRFLARKLREFEQLKAEIEALGEEQARSAALGRDRP